MLARLERMYEDPKARVRLVRWFWLISTGVMLLGFGIIVWRAITPP